MIKQFLKYSISLAVAIGVLWFVLRDVAVDELLDKLDQINYFWVGLSVFFGLVSYFARTYRWNLLLAPLGYRPGFVSTFLATMIGYLANMVLPRLGEVMRCGFLKKSNDVPVSSSLGTVVAERVFDFILLLLVVGATLVLEFDKLQDFLFEIFSGGTEQEETSAFWYLVIGLLLAGVLVFWYFWNNREQIRQHSLYRKIVTFLQELVDGVLSVRKLENFWGFIIATLLIWVMYYLMSYVIVFSMPQTSDISLAAGLAILAMGGIGMAAPVQGGLGTYHLLVSGVLMVYGASKNDAVLLAFVLHTSQTILVVVAGVISLVVSFFRNDSEPAVSLNHESNTYNR